MQKDNFLLVITTIDSKHAAKKLSRLILKQKLAACIQIDAIESFYRWQGKVSDEKEFRLMIKTSKQKYSELEQTIQANHPYELPEIIATKIQTGLDGYLDWMKRTLD